MEVKKTRAEFTDLYDSLYYGHEAELIVSNKRYYLENCDNGFEIYAYEGEEGHKISQITALDRNELLDKLFSTPIFDGKSLNENYGDFCIIAID